MTPRRLPTTRLMDEGSVSLPDVFTDGVSWVRTTPVSRFSPTALRLIASFVDGVSNSPLLPPDGRCGEGRFSTAEHMGLFVSSPYSNTKVSGRSVVNTFGWFISPKTIRTFSVCEMSTDSDYPKVEAFEFFSPIGTFRSDDDPPFHASYIFKPGEHSAEESVKIMSGIYTADLIRVICAEPPALHTCGNSGKRPSLRLVK